MKAASAGTIALLATGQFYLAELYTITLIGGTVVRFSAAPEALTVGANTWPLTGLSFKRGSTNTSVGLETDQMDVTIYADPNDATAVINGVPFAEFCLLGGLDGATLQIDRCFMGTWGDTSNGLVTWFYGLVSDIKPGRLTTVITVKDLTERLMIQYPREVYQVPCLHTLYDVGCTLNKATFAVNSSATGASTRYVVASALAQATDYFALGFLVFTSGANNGEKRSIKAFSGGSLSLNFPLPVAPANGDTFTVYPGCDRMQATCTTKFSNLANFRGFPYIPEPETAR